MSVTTEPTKTSTQRPTPDPQLVPDIAAWIKRFVVLPSDDHAIILALWVLHTWSWELCQATPYLYINSAEKQCGKTRLIEVLEVLVRNPLRATSVTPSVLFRAIDTMSPTLLLDEVDTVWSGSRNEIMRNIINGGYREGGFVLRIQNQQPKKFKTFCPKLLAGIFNGFMPDTIVDRAIPIKLVRKDKHAMTEPFYAKDVANSIDANELLDRIERFIKLHAKDIAFQRPEAITQINDRQWEISEPLVALAEVFGEGERVRKAIVGMFKDVEDSPSLISILFEDIRQVFGGRDKVFTEELVDSLGGSWNGKMLSVWLAPHGITPDQIRIGNRTGKGYRADQFASAWEAE